MKTTKNSTASSGYLDRLVRGFLVTWCSDWKWARKLVGGRWERWWVEPVQSLAWMHEPEYLPNEKRPPACDIGVRFPKPYAVEIYSANTD
jgi:hypothetical protein